MDWTQNYFGKDLDRDDCEEILCLHWKEAARRAEAGLFKTKWFDLRHLHPVQATYLFGHLFIEETRAIIRAHLDPRSPRKLADGSLRTWQPLRDGDFLSPPVSRVTQWEVKISSLVRARQFADRNGIPYGIFVRAGLKRIYFGHYYFVDGTRATLPHPRMLNGEDCRLAILEAWQQELEGRIQSATHPRYLLTNKVDHSDITEHQAFLVQQIKRKPNPSFALRRFIMERRLSVTVAKEAFGIERVKQALLPVLPTNRAPAHPAISA